MPTAENGNPPFDRTTVWLYCVGPAMGWCKRSARRRNPPHAIWAPPADAIQRRSVEVNAVLKRYPAPSRVGCEQSPTFLQLQWRRTASVVRTTPPIFSERHLTSVLVRGSRKVLVYNDLTVSLPEVV